MARRYSLGRAGQRVPHLLKLLGNQGIGALIYGESAEPPSFSVGPSSRHLPELAILAEKFEKDPESTADEDLSLLFQAGSSPGGARPKALITDDGKPYLAKFASTKDQMDVVSLEAATMELARRSGVKTAKTSLVPLGSRKCLLVKRFDINVAGGRNHLITMQSLLKADGYYNIGYKDMAEVIKHISASPQQDLQMLYRQMVFNVMMGNTDDHLKNFCMLHDDQGWRLSPAFDLTPNIGFNQEHVLRIGPDNRPSDIETLFAEARYFGIQRRQSAADVVQSVCSAVSEWPAIFSAHDVPEKDTEIIGNEIKKNLARLYNKPF